MELHDPTTNFLTNEPLGSVVLISIETMEHHHHQNAGPEGTVAPVDHGHATSDSLAHDHTRDNVMLFNVHAGRCDSYPVNCRSGMLCPERCSTLPR